MRPPCYLVPSVPLHILVHGPGRQLRDIGPESFTYGQRRGKGKVLRYLPVFEAACRRWKRDRSVYGSGPLGLDAFRLGGWAFHWESGNAQHGTCACVCVYIQARLHSGSFGFPYLMSCLPGDAAAPKQHVWWCLDICVRSGQAIWRSGKCH